MVSPGNGHPPAHDSSYTAAAGHTTAAAVGKQYAHDFAVAPGGEQRGDGGDDGHVTSEQYARRARLVGQDGTPEALRIDFHHPLEDWLGRRPARWLLRWLSAERPLRRFPARWATTVLERAVFSYRNAAVPLSQRVRYWPIHFIIDLLRGRSSPRAVRKRLAEHVPTVRGLTIVARSVGEFGLTVPQRFSVPLLAVWNFTNRCNLACRHCYQDSARAALADELTRDEKLRLVDEMGGLHMPMLAISGGEPTLSDDLLPVVRRSAGWGMHLSLATNGTTMTAELAGRLAEAGLRYVEISLDSVDAARHDAFRGVRGMWRRAVAGARVVAATPPLRLGIAMCVHSGNVGEVEAMIDFAEQLGAGCFAHFNFIPVGRGLRMVSGDIAPARREELLDLLNRRMQAGGMGVISTAPQLGRVCLAGAALEGRTACSHAGSGSGAKARVVAKYLGGCGAGRCYVCVEPDGDVTPCVYLPHRVMGNVRRRPLAEIFRSSVFWDVLNDRTRRLHHCRVCAFRDYCGGCRARADAYFGQLHAGDPGCIFNERHWEALVASGVAVVPDASTAPADLHLTATRHGPA